MKTNFSFIIALILLLSSSCKSGNPRGDVLKKDSNIFYVNIDSVTSSIDLKLSDIAENIRLVALETTEESLFSAATYFVDSECILVIGNGVYKFSSKGTFIKKLLKSGRGPEEVPLLLKYAISDKYNLLLIDSYPNSNTKLMAYDYEEESLNLITKAIEGFWYSMGIVNDTVFVGVIHDRYQTDSVKHAYFYQNYKGELISTIPNVRKAFSIYPIGGGEVYQNAWILQGDNFNYLRFTATTDTLFKLIEGQLFPYIILRKDTPGKYPPTIGPDKEGDRNFGFSRIENPAYSILTEGIITEVEKVSIDAARISRDSYYYFLNKSTGKTHKINSYKDDLIGKVQVSDGNRINFPRAQTNGMLYAVYYPHELKQLDIASMKSKAFSLDLYKQLESLAKNIDESDNPILLIGDVKDSIVLN